MTGEEAIAYIEHIPWQGVRLGLERTQELLERLGSPEKELRFVHIAGTNGKGSTAAMLAAVLQSAGYRTGLYISPFLQVFNERMSVNGAMISGEELGKITEQVRHVAEAMEDRPTEFELMTAIAFLYFRQQRCDIVVLEVGMGGRLDSTNVIGPPEAAVICNIGLDHVKELGGTVEQIAFEKAGIIKPGCEAVLYQPEKDSVAQVVRAACRERNAGLHEADFSQLRLLENSIEGQRFSYRDWEDLCLCLLGAHQLKNAAVALETVSVLRGRGWKISDEAVRQGLSEARWPGRFEVLRADGPIFLADGGHNRQCAEAVAVALKEYFPGKNIYFIMGVLADKDYASMLAVLAPLGGRFYTVTPDSPRALSAAALARELSVYGKPTDVCQSVAEAVAKALRSAGRDDVVCSVGSLYMTGEIRSAVLGLPAQAEQG